MKKRILNILMVVCALVFLGSGAFVGVNLLMYHNQQKTFDEMAEEFPEEETAPAVVWQEVSPTVIEEVPERYREAAAEAVANLSENSFYTDWGDDASGGDEAVYAPVSADEWLAWWNTGFDERQEVYEEVEEQTNDVVGWVRIDGTPINYPVCHTPEDPEKYIHKDVNGNYSSYGTPFLDGACRLSPRSSLLIYGHHMRNGSMFAALQNYSSLSYYRQHPFIQFDTFDEPGTYQIALVVKVDAEGLVYPWQSLLFPADEEEFAWALWLSQLYRPYDTGVELSYGDELLALVTCEYSQANGRMMVVARRIS